MSAPSAFGQHSARQVERIASGNKNGKVFYLVYYVAGSDRTDLNYLYENGEPQKNKQILDFKHKERGYLEVKFNKIENEKERFYFIINENCVTESDHLDLLHTKSDLPIKTKKNHSNYNKNLHFRVLKEGSGEITIRYAVTTKKNHRKVKCDDGEITIKYEIRNLFKAPTITPPPTAKKEQIQIQPIENKEEKAWIEAFDKKTSLRCVPS